MSLLEYCVLSTLAVIGIIRAVFTSNAGRRDVEGTIAAAIFVGVISGVMLPGVVVDSHEIRHDHFIWRAAEITDVSILDMQKWTHADPPYIGYTVKAYVLPAGQFGAIYYPEETIHGYAVFVDGRRIGATF